MRKFVLGVVLACSALAASAQVTGQLTNTSGSFLTLSGPANCSALAPCNLGTIGTIVGGATYDSGRPTDAAVAGMEVNGNFLSAGPTSGSTATLTFNTPQEYLSFLWGSPDTYNMLTVNSTTGSQLFTAQNLGFPVTDGTQSFSQYVEFVANTGSLITSLVFTNSPAIDAFETANFSVVRAVPEPETYALMLAGFGALGFIARRRKTKSQ